MKRVLRHQMLGEMCKSRSAGQVLEVLRHMLREVQLRSIWDLWKQARVRLLQEP